MDDPRFIGGGGTLPDVTLGVVLFLIIVFLIGTYLENNRRVSHTLGGLLIVLFSVVALLQIFEYVLR